jgi:hypothetical protein
MAAELGVCKTCRAEIQWAVLAQKPHPFDADPTTDGTYMLVDTPTEVRTVAVYVAREKRKAGDRLHKSHFATCPNAAAHRTKR